MAAFWAVLPESRSLRLDRLSSCFLICSTSRFVTFDSWLWLSKTRAVRLSFVRYLKRTSMNWGISLWNGILQKSKKLMCLQVRWLLDLATPTSS